MNGLLRFASIDWKEAKFPVSKAIDDLGLHLLHLFPAGRAPRGEEGKQHHVALQVGQGDRCVVEHSDREVRGLLSDAERAWFPFPSGSLRKGSPLGEYKQEQHNSRLYGPV